MTHYLSLTTSMPHPPFPYATRDEARMDVNKALATGLYVREDPDVTCPGETNALLFQVGPGSILRVLSEKRMLDLTREKQQQQVLHGSGLIVPAPEKPPQPYKLVIQTAAGQMDPLEFETREQARKTVEEGVGRGWLYHEVHVDENTGVDDELFVQTGPGTLFIVLSTKTYEAERRAQLEMMARARAAQTPAPHPSNLFRR